MNNLDNINSDMYWDTRFSEDWEACEGPRQSRFFAKIAIEQLPKWLLDQLKQQSLTLGDWGCAQGDGTEVWTNYIDASQLVGIDFSSVAIQQAAQRYPAIRFLNEDWLVKNNEGVVLDIVFSSNTLEHFHQPYETLLAISSHAKKAIVLALPYKEIDRIDEHFYSFLPNNIPLVLDNGFRLVWSKVVDCRPLPNTLWGGDQIILVYANSAWIDSLNLTLENCAIEQTDINSELSSVNKEIHKLGQVITANDAQTADLKQTITAQEAHTQTLIQMNATQQTHIASLNQLIIERDAWLAIQTQRIDTLHRSRSWRMTAPVRWLGVFLRLCLGILLGRRSTDLSPAASGSTQSRLSYITSRLNQGIQRHGLLRAIPLALRASTQLGSAWLNKRMRHRLYQRRLDELSQMITSHQNFIDLFHVPMGWSTPLFQRFQHMSLQAAQLGGLALYGGHLQVDKDLFVYKRAEGNVIVFDALDEQVNRCVFDALQKTQQKTVLRIQSIDLATRIADVERFIQSGLTVVYEYIDEISEEITGAIPEFVIERHKWLLSKPDVLVVATSDKLLAEALKYRTHDCMISTNGVDLAHWRQAVEQPPKDILPALNTGRFVIGYHGALANWIDYDLLRRIADDGKYELVLIGYEHDTSFADSGLLDHHRVHFLGSKSYFMLNQYAKYYDIGILPFKRYALTESVSPVKLFEYMAAGKPVVTTDLRECSKYASCLVSDHTDLFLENIYIAIHARNDQKYNAALNLDAEQNSWTQKAASVFQAAGVNLGLELHPENKNASTLNNHVEGEEVVNQALYQFLRQTYWKLPLPEKTKENIVAQARIFGRGVKRAFTQPRVPATEKQDILKAYVEQVLALPSKPGGEHIEIAPDSYQRQANDPKVLAYYLPQFHPTPENDAWWGKGVTEWNNVSRAVPQYLGHYQPRLPGELGYYDLRIEDNLRRQVELAQMYGVYGFTFYFYWFDGVRLLDKPLDMFLNAKDIDFPFSLCWANESWTRRFDGSSGTILMQQSETVESYVAFIESVIPYMQDARYIRVGTRPVLTVYRPSFVPDCKNTLTAWRERCIAAGVGDPYIIGVKEHTWDADLLALGYDAQSEFHPGTLFKHCEDISSEIDYIRPDFGGIVLDYSDIVENKKYFQYSHPKLYRAVMPMWDNTARRDNKGMIFENASPILYQQWLKDIFADMKTKQDLDDTFVFINAWNEWGEGAYLEPDKKYGYAFLDATRKAIEESR